ncbi:MAG: ABC transporter permease [Christensenellales bacterium]|jgi:NitT/TauT family transport system permease protein|nr:ABC transporter permease subunit [Clostridiales bacterium]
MKLKNYLNLLYPLIALAVFFAVWLIAAEIIKIEVILPHPAQAFKQLLLLVKTMDFWTAIGHTLLRTFISFFISMSLALLLAALSSLFKPVYFLLSPLVIISRAVPTMSVILLSLIWFTSDITPMFIAFLIVFPMLYAGFYSAINNIDKDLIEMSKLYKVSKRIIVTKFYIPYIMPSFFDSVRSAISLNVKLIIAAEVLSQTRHSMGVMMQISKQYLDTASLIAWTIAAIVLSYLLEIAVAVLKKLCVRWK